MSENRIISFIHEVNSLDRKWKNLTAEQKRALLQIIGNMPTEPEILKAMRKVKRAK